MPNTVQLTQNGQPVYPVTDVSLITGLEERSGMRVIPYTTRPTASAETAGFIYMDESTKDLYVTKATSGSYSWVSAGNLSNINLDNYATKTELEQLGQEVHNLSGKYYGVFTSSSSLPAGDVAGYAFVGTAAPFAIYNFDGTDWTDSGATVDSIHGEPGVGFASVASQQDGTLVITLTNNDTITLDLNHNHPAYYSKVAETSNPSGGFLPDVVYSLGTLTGTVVFALAAAVTGNVNHYFWMFDTGSTAPTITWPTGITWADGSAPSVAASKHYEVSILGGIAYYSEV